VKVDWEDDWPIFNNGSNITILTEGRHGHQLPRNPAWKANLNQDALELGWYHKREFLHILPPTQRYIVLNIILDTPLKREWSLSARPGHIRLYGSCYDLSSSESPTMLLRKQTHVNQTFQVKLDFQPSYQGCEAGIIIWYSMYSYASMGITMTSHETGEKKKSVLVRRPTSEIGVTGVSRQIERRFRLLIPE
jgi:beta-xylosidase